ncbi:MAG TPA: hypothetical protein VIQ62_10605, partial [Burkholderiales bacterium]
MTALRRQHGYAMLAVLILAGALVTSAIYVWSAPHEDALSRDLRTTAALAVARDALIGRAASDNTRPGSLPCPDTDNDGVADGAFGNCSVYVGRLPWRTLGLPDLRDGAGERLWYVLSSTFRDNASAGVLNSDTPGAYIVKDAAGTVLTTDAPALVIAPGLALGSQSREGGNGLAVAMYLDGENANGDVTYVTGAVDAVFNDRVVVLGRDDIFRSVTARVAKAALVALETYRSAHGYYPAANAYSTGAPAYLCDPTVFQGRIPRTIKTVTPPSGCIAHDDWSLSSPEVPAWFFGNDWHLLTHYAVAGVCAATSLAAQSMCASAAYDVSGTAFPGSVPLSIAGVSGNARVLVIVSGPARAGQTRPCSDAAQCLDDAANSDGDASYVKPSRWPDSN